MTQPIAKVRADLFAFVARFVSKEETRYYLNGVYIEPHPKKGVLIVATDGRRLGVGYDEDGACKESGIWPVTTPLLSACTRKRPLQVGQVTVEFDGRFAVVSEGANPDFAALSVCIDAKYPDWRRVVPKSLECGDHPLVYNAKYLAGFKPPAPNTAIQLYSSGPKEPATVLVSGMPEFIGVLMPMRAEDGLALPDWLQVPKERRSKKAA